MRKAEHGTPKRQSGISLVPELWDAIDQAAKLAGVPRNRVMERVLMEKFGMVSATSDKTYRTSREARGEPVVELAP